ncbi:MAG: hypothetical protein Q4G21_00650 [Dermabacter sp.]|nr:hypothetical protein [Dermabacter sp.]
MNHESAPFESVLIGTGLGVYTLATALHAEYGVPSTIVTRVAIDAMRTSVACATRELGPEASLQDIVAELMALGRTRAAEAYALGEEPPRMLLMCNEDGLVELLAAHRDELEKYYAVPIPSDAALARMVDKAEFSLLCDDLGVPTPRTEIVDFSTDAPIPASEIAFPLVAKVARVSDLQGLDVEGYRKVYFLTSQEELDRVWAAHRRAGFRGRFVVQDLIPGDDTSMWSITAYRDARGVVTLTACARVLLEEHTPDALGRPAAMLTMENDELFADAEKILHALDYRGFANFDVKHDARSGDLTFFELNPRIGRNNYYVTAAGANIARFVVSDAIQRRDIEPVTVSREVLYSLVPVSLLRRYVSDPDLWARVRAAARRGVANPWAYGPDGLRAKAYAKAVAFNHVRKFRRYYPKPTATGF